VKNICYNIKDTKFWVCLSGMHLYKQNNNCSLKYEIDLKRIEEDKKYDGFYAIASSRHTQNFVSLIL